MNVAFLCSGVITRGTEVFPGGVLQTRDDWVLRLCGSWGEWREVESCESHSGGICCLFLSWKWRWVCYLKTSVSIAFCGGHTSLESASHGPLQRSLSAEYSGTSRLKAAPLGLLFSSLGCQTCCPALSSQDTSQWGLVKQESCEVFFVGMQQLEPRMTRGAYKQTCQGLEEEKFLLLSLLVYVVSTELSYCFTERPSLH